MATVAAYSSLDGAKFKRPSLIDALGEFRLPVEATVSLISALTTRWPHAQPGQRKVVMLIPGFMAGDTSLMPLANFLHRLGHRTVFGGIISNSNCPRETIRILSARLKQAHIRFGQRIVVIGQSLGGVYARELAQEHPQLVERVITLGSPIRQPRDAANLAVQAMARSMAAIRGKADGCLSESCRCGMMISDAAPVDVPLTAIYSRSDGIVHWESCIDRSGVNTVENVEISGSHCGMGVNVEAYHVIAERLALPRRPKAQHPGAASNDAESARP
jgi:triacylglycerol lipase